VSTIDRLWKLLLAGCAGGAGLVGCSHSPDPAKPPDDGRPNAAIQSVSADESAHDGAAIDFGQSFEQAVSTEVLEGQFLPPDATAAGKKTAKLRAAVEAVWPKIKLTDTAGKPVDRIVELETTAGVIEITLQPELAPNHVRNMLALAHLGFYDGLFFERIIRQAGPEGDDGQSEPRLVIAGCPKGTGEEGYGHLGYLMRAEFQDDLKHVEGTVGFWHEESPDSAGTRFYIALGPAPALDGRFTIVGHITKGIDIVKLIAAAPVKSDDPASAESEKPAQPTSIKKVSIRPDPMEK
jgi:peptidyl-prolyl cis-trans isomerase B (cyclophilin B)